MQWPSVTSWADSLSFSTCLEMAVHINILIRWRALKNPQIVKWKGCRFILILLQWRGVRHWRGQPRNVSLILTSPKVSSCQRQLRCETPGGDLFCGKQFSVLCQTFHFLQTANAPSAKGRQMICRNERQSIIWNDRCFFNHQTLYHHIVHPCRQCIFILSSCNDLFEHFHLQTVDSTATNDALQRYQETVWGRWILMEVSSTLKFRVTSFI